MYFDAAKSLDIPNYFFLFNYDFIENSCSEFSQI